MKRHRIILGISGASGVPIAIEILRFLQELKQIETHLVVSAGATLTIQQETSMQLHEITSLADDVHDNSNIGAAIASGSFKTLGMMVVPCSMKTLAGIAHGYSENLLLRAADVCLKEKRRLVLAVRECPFSAIHLKNMLTLSEMGAVILPPVLTYYNNPRSVADMTSHIAGKILDLFDFDLPAFKRWGPNETA
ncbi:UbiX family flavin prenyltransferase [Desulfovibrio sp. OttesenSCG-928-M16]|nr:UbiX family flavin prenyltransferase [Desulfovibrio sp. OttesenSCG-928-M16]